MISRLLVEIIGVALTFKHPPLDGRLKPCRRWPGIVAFHIPTNDGSKDNMFAEQRFPTIKEKTSRTGDGSPER
jgi:hypothetical protein